MRVLFDNCDFSSSAGPHSFAHKLAKQLSFMGHILADGSDADVQLSVISMTRKLAPTVLRLDGIYFNTAADWNQLNGPLYGSYRAAERVVAQTEFNRELLERYFGPHDGMTVIRNGTDLQEIEAVKPMESSHLDRFDSVWCCASSWRPHKRLAENIRYFFENAGRNDCLVIAGENPDVRISDPRVFYAGQLDRPVLLSLYRRSGHFLHLSYIDHCPNVVVDARASGCHVVVASSGGTHEVAGSDSTIVKDIEWDWEPLELYKPPRLDFDSTWSGSDAQSIDIIDVAVMYEEVLQLAINHGASNDQDVSPSRP